MSAAHQFYMRDDLLGRRLRSERERRKVTLESIAIATKINIGLLQDLERDDVSKWPSGIFRRSFIRSYAEAIGLDPDDVAQEFQERYPDLQQLKANAAQAGQHPSSGHQSGLRLTLADVPRPFSGGRLLRNAAVRLKAAAWDCGAILALATISYIVLGAFWIPLAVVCLTYYIGGIVILGNSPGVCLFAPKLSEDHPQTPAPHGEDALDLPTVAASTFTR